MGNCGMRGRMKPIKTMKLKNVIPARSFRLLGTDIALKAGVPHRAIDATNQPEWKAKGLLFVYENGSDMDDCRSILLGRGEYRRAKGGVL
jgi:hypothetical protein